MKRQQEIDRVYELVKHKYEAKVFQFGDVWKTLVKEDKLSKQEQATLMGSLYTDLLQDARFLYVGNQKWRLREFATSAEIVKYKNALYDFIPEVVEDDVITTIDVGKDEQLLEEEQYNSEEMSDEDDETAQIKKTSHPIDDEEGNE